MAPGRRSSERRFYFFMPSSGRGGGQEQRLPDRIRILSGTRRKEGVGVRESFSDYCRRTGQEGLLDQWQTEENLPLTPGTVSSGSSRKVWWTCPRGHQWQAEVFARARNGSGCPYCTGKLPIPGETDLASRFPALAREWHPTKNAPLTPDQVLPGSHRTVWWVCPQGHQWRAQIKSRTAGSGCPVCANRAVLPGENDLAATFPALARQWHPEKNGALTPHDVTAGAHRKVWWQCEKGHEWRASVLSRSAGGAGCPVCAGKTVLPGENDLAAMFPALAAQWDPGRNGALTPDRVSPCSNRKVWWRCPRGHPYQAVVAARTMRGSGCPYCAGRRALPGFNDLATVCPDIAAQWHPTLNGGLTPEMVTAGSRKKVWWQCPEGHVWRAVVYARAGEQRSGCPVCAGTARRRRPGGCLSA